MIGYAMFVDNVSGLFGRHGTLYACNHPNYDYFFRPDGTFTSVAVKANQVRIDV